MKLLWYVKQLGASRKQPKRIPNAQPFLLWTRETGEWREMTPKARQS